MTNPTSNFGWQMPTPTDLVTDLPADFEVFGQAVDTDFADLLGGTTGQILSKASATDLDFTWITNDVGDITAVTAGTGISGGGSSGAVTITNSMATAIDAKGDLIAGTGADTFARLGVGANYAFLQADSTQTTGLIWNNAAWTTYSPTLTANSGTFTTATATGKYIRIGKMCVVVARGVITTVGTGINPEISLPFTAVTNANLERFMGSVRENSVTGLSGVSVISSAATKMLIFRYDNNAYQGDGYAYTTTIAYEVA